MSFLAELRRRHVIKVSLAYIVMAWLVLQVADVFLAHLGLPEWAFKLVLFLLILGFPVIITFTWAYDLNREGITRTAAAPVLIPDGPASDPTPTEADEAIAPAPPQRASVAVLPFVNMSGDPNNEYFSDGLSEELLNVLTNIRSLKVAARTSSFHFKGQTGDIADIARRLGVASVLEGSVRQAGLRVRITAQLINAADGYHLWSETYDRELDDIFAVQDDIASSVAEALKVRLLGGQDGHLSIGGTSNSQAFQAYLQGMHYRKRGASDEANLRSAVAAFQDAIRLDPDYAQAYAGLAFTWDQLSTNSFCSFEEGINSAMVAASKAIDLAPGLADGHMVLARLLHLYKLDQKGARKSVDTALQLNPGNPDVQLGHAMLSAHSGDVEASVAAARKAVELDPVSLHAHHFLGHMLYFGRRYDEAIPVFRDVLKLDPKFPRPRYTLGMCLYMKGQPEAALQEVRNETLGWMRHSGSAIVLGRLGRTEEARAALDALVKKDDEEYAIYQVGQVYAQWGDHERAIHCVKRALALRDPGVAQLKVDPLMDPLRDHAEFPGLLATVGFG